LAVREAGAYLIGWSRQKERPAAAQSLGSPRRITFLRLSPEKGRFKQHEAEKRI